MGENHRGAAEMSDESKSETYWNLKPYKTDAIYVYCIFFIHIAYALLNKVVSSIAPWQTFRMTNQRQITYVPCIPSTEKKENLSAVKNHPTSGGGRSTQCWK